MWPDTLKHHSYPVRPTKLRQPAFLQKRTHEQPLLPLTPLSTLGPSPSSRTDTTSTPTNSSGLSTVSPSSSSQGFNFSRDSVRQGHCGSPGPAALSRRSSPPPAPVLLRHTCPGPRPPLPADVPAATRAPFSPQRVRPCVSQDGWLCPRPVPQLPRPSPGPSPPGTTSKQPFRIEKKRAPFSAVTAQHRLVELLVSSTPVPNPSQR